MQSTAEKSRRTPRKKALKSDEWDEIIKNDPNKKFSFKDLTQRLTSGSEVLISWRKTGIWVGAEVLTITNYPARYGKYSKRSAKIDITFGMWVKQDVSYVMETMSITIKKYSGKINIEILGFKFITSEEKQTIIERVKPLIQTTFNSPDKRIRNGDQSLFIVKTGVGSLSVRRYSGVFVVDKDSFNSWHNSSEDRRRFDEDSYSSVDEVCEIPKGKEWMLLQFVIAFHLPSRNWGYLDYSYTTPPIFDLKAWESLVLDSKLKSLLEGVIRCARKDLGAPTDFVANKGQGFNILLHGSSGLGKTLTAQALSSQHQKVVFSLNAGDLGSNIEKVEEQLAFITNIVSRWNIYIQIDECDLFISNRMDSLVINELTCAFLRFLENHPTIVFLTTNMQIRDIDPAIRTRIHVFVEFPIFSVEDRQQVWINLLKLYCVDDVEPFLSNFGQEKLNGREIRNILYVAKARMNADGRKIITVDDVKESMKLSLINNNISNFTNLYQ